jgi:hypothetical protein
VNLENEINDRAVGMHLVGPGYDVKEHDGSHVGANPPSLAPSGGEYRYEWTAQHEGVFPFHDGGDYSGGEDGTNVHGLFGAFIVEPVGTIWRDPVSGLDSSGDGVQLDGLYLDIIPPEAQAAAPIPAPSTIENYQFPAPREYTDYNRDAHREFVVFFHDEPEFVPPHGTHYPDPCAHPGDPSAGMAGTARPDRRSCRCRYRAEPMVNKEQILFRLMQEGHNFKGRPGPSRGAAPQLLDVRRSRDADLQGLYRRSRADPLRPRGGEGDPRLPPPPLRVARRARGPKSPRIDAISVSPQTGHTIEPVWGAGNRHQVAGDVIWHCHLYPHFHEGHVGHVPHLRDAAGRQRRTGPCPAGLPLHRPQDRPVSGLGTRIERLLPLPGRTPPPLPTATHPGYPLYIPGEIQQKSRFRPGR